MRTFNFLLQFAETAHLITFLNSLFAFDLFNPRPPVRRPLSRLPRPANPRPLAIALFSIFFTMQSRLSSSFPTTLHNPTPTTQPPPPNLRHPTPTPPHAHDRQQRPALGYHDGGEEALMQVVPAPSAELERRR